MIASNRQEDVSVKVVTFCSAFTCLYVPALLVALSLTSHLYSVGKYSSCYLLLALLLGEIIKIIHANLQPEPPHKENLKLIKPKKPHKLKMRDFFKILLMLPVCTLVYFVLVILFGAPVMSHYEETFMLSLLLTILTVFPSCFQVGVDACITLLTGMKWFTGDPVMEMLQQNILIALLGTWCGGIVIPLDWDRPWQVWPIPCCLGALIGYTISNFITLAKLVPFVAKRIAKKNKF